MDLSDDEASQMCQDMGKTLVKMFSDKDMLCTLAGLTVKSRGMDCLTTYDKCMAGTLKKKADNPGEDWSCTIKKFSAKDCKATVAEMEACFNQSLKVMHSAFSGLTCSTELDSKAAKNIFDTVNFGTTACEAVKKKCPGLAKASK